MSVFNRRTGSHGLAALHHQIGNQAVQRLLAQRQADVENEPNATVEVGEIKIEPPTVEYYEVEGDSLPEVLAQVEPPEQWLAYHYDPQPKADRGLVTQVDITVSLKLRLPQWVEPGWEHAPDDERTEWLILLQHTQGSADGYEDSTTLPQQWLLGPAWSGAEDALKSAWQEMLQTMQETERSPVEIARRRAIVLQQRLINQPEGEVTTIVGQFLADLQAEDDAYHEQIEFGQADPIELNPDALIQ